MLEPVLSPRAIRNFIDDGFCKLDDAFSRDIAEQARKILWRDTGCDPDQPASWTRSVVRLGSYSDPPFLTAAGAPRLTAAIDQLVGAGRWLPLRSLGTFPVRFPSETDPGDTGWHVDASFPPPPGTPDPSYFSWRINVRSQGRGLLLLFLFSDTAEDDAPTRLRVGSHLDAARILAPMGEQGLSFMDLAARLDGSAARPEALATGPAGTVYLCHPFLAHAAQPHRGAEPRFMAQPPLVLRQPLELRNRDLADFSPVEVAVRRALGLA